MVADAVVYHPAIAQYLRFVSQTQGRDKLLRTIQYFSRFYAWYLFRTNHSQSTVSPWENAKKNFGAARKLLRLFKWVEHIKAAAVAYDNVNADPVVRYMAIGRQLGYVGYLFLDNITVLHTANLRPLKHFKTLADGAYKAWFTGLMFSITSNLYTLYVLQEKLDRHHSSLASASASSSSADEKSPEASVELVKIAKERNQATLQLVQDTCDILVPGHSLGYIGGLDDGIVGLAGTVSSILGAYTVWKKVG